jgi:O-antigen ligase
LPIATARRIGSRPKPRPLWTSREAFLTDAGLFLLGAAGASSVSIVGALPGCEVLLLPVLPVLLLARGKRAFDRRYLWFFILTGAWLLGTLISDAYNGIGALNRAKGIARIAFLVLDFTALAILINNKIRRIVIFALSFAVVEFTGSWQFRAGFAQQWKFGVAEGVAVVALLVSSHFYIRRRYGICFLIAMILAGLNLRYGFRSQLVVQLVAAVLVLPLFDEARTGRNGSHAGQNRWKVIVLLVLAGGAAYAANAAIKYGSKIGLFDESTSAKFEGQASGDYGVLVGGRPETLVAIQAIRDSPIIGHGSFAYGQKYMQMKADIQYEHGYSDSDEPEEVEYPTIPTHSHLTMAWVEGGILGGICWIYIFALTVRSIFHLSSLRPNLAPLYCYFLVGFLWDILYSPFGSVNRIWGAYFILLSYFILKTSEEQAQLVRQARAKQISIGRNLRPRRIAAAYPGANLLPGRR